MYNPPAKPFEFQAWQPMALVFALASCHWTATLANDLSPPSPDRPSRETFTFKGQLPENFGIRALVSYVALDPERPQCQEIATGGGPGKFEVRRYGKAHEAPISNQTQSFSFDIPLSYSVERCDMELGRINLMIRAKHGEQSWQKTYADGALKILEELPPNAPDFNEDGVLSIHGKCYWMFQESRAHSRPGEIEKLMSCRGAGAYLPFDRLAGKTVTLGITVVPDEEPTYRNTWIKFDNGWKPCLPKPGGWIRCQSPPIFKTFKMNGKTCTIYPGCTEQ